MSCKRRSHQQRRQSTFQSYTRHWPIQCGKLYTTSQKGFRLKPFSITIPFIYP